MVDLILSLKCWSLWRLYRLFSAWRDWASSTHFRNNVHRLERRRAKDPDRAPF